MKVSATFIIIAPDSSAKTQEQLDFIKSQLHWQSEQESVEVETKVDVIAFPSVV